MTQDNEKKPPYNWVKIETDYVTDPTHTYDSLCKKYGPKPNAICRHAQEGNWKQKRFVFQEQKARKTQEKLAEQRAIEAADEIAKLNKAHFESQQGI